MTPDEIVTCAELAFTQGMGTLMLQSGELPTEKRIEWMLEVVRAVRKKTVEMDLAREKEREREREGKEGGEGERHAGTHIHKGTQPHILLTSPPHSNKRTHTHTHTHTHTRTQTLTPRPPSVGLPLLCH